MSVRWVTREDLGWPVTPADDAPCLSGLVIHYDGNDQRLTSKPHSACVSYWNATRNNHINSNRWADIGYSFGACPHGYVFEGRGFQKQQAAQQGGNTTWHSVTTMSGPNEDVSEPQRKAVSELHKWLTNKGVSNVQRGHRDFDQTSCPGDIVYGMIRAGSFAPSGENQERMIVPEFVHLVHSPDTPGTALTLDSWHSISFNEERQDTGSNHGSGAQTFAGHAQYVGSIQVQVSGLEPGSKVYLRTVDDDSEGQLAVAYPRGEIAMSENPVYFSHPFVGRVGIGRRVKTQIMTTGAGIPMLERATLVAHVWPL